MSQIETIMLIDDNRADNFYHEVVIKKADFSGELFVFQYAGDALSFLKTVEHSIDLILLDINMPRMSGFEFLAAYHTLLTPEQRAKAIIIMLTTSLNPADEARAKAHPDVKGFLNKPLTPTGFQEIVRDFFKEMQ
mgnify:CR=1 FL=1